MYTMNCAMVFVSSDGSTFSTSIRLLSSFFIKHCILFHSVSVHLSLFSFCGAPQSSLPLDTYMHYPVKPSGDHFPADAVVPSSDHCCTDALLTPSDHYCMETVAPSGDHYYIDTVVPSSDHCCIGAVPSPSDDYRTTKVAPPSYHLHTKRT